MQHRIDFLQQRFWWSTMEGDMWEYVLMSLPHLQSAKTLPTSACWPAPPIPHSSSPLVTHLFWLCHPSSPLQQQHHHSNHCGSIQQNGSFHSPPKTPLCQRNGWVTPLPGGLSPRYPSGCVWDRGSQRDLKRGHGSRPVSLSIPKLITDFQRLNPDQSCPLPTI